MKRSPLTRKTKMRSVAKRKGATQAAVIVMDDGREVTTNGRAGRAEYARRTLIMAERQNFLCCFCRGPMRDDWTFDHEAGRTSGRKDERLLHADDVTWRNGAAHGACNCGAGSVRHHWIDRNTRYVPLTREERLAA